MRSQGYQAGKNLPARRRTAPGRYSLRAGRHRILYAVDEEARLITIQRIRRRRAG